MQITCQFCNWEVAALVSEKSRWFGLYKSILSMVLPRLCTYSIWGGIPSLLLTCHPPLRSLMAESVQRLGGCLVERVGLVCQTHWSLIGLRFVQVRISGIDRGSEIKRTSQSACPGWMKRTESIPPVERNKSPLAYSECAEIKVFVLVMLTDAVSPSLNRNGPTRVDCCLKIVLFVKVHAGAVFMVATMF